MKNQKPFPSKKLFVPVLWQRYIDACVEDIANKTNLNNDEKARLFDDMYDELSIFHPEDLSKSKVYQEDSTHPYVYNVMPSKLKIALETREHDHKYAFLVRNFILSNQTPYCYIDSRGAMIHRLVGVLTP